MFAWGFKLAQGNLNNNPPVGDFEGDSGSSTTVDPNLGDKKLTPLALLVVLPPVMKIPVL